MPRGTYRAAHGDESFSCAPGPVGWRYVSDRLDLACDCAWRPVRFVVRGAVVLRGGGARLDDGTPVLVVRRGDDERELISRADVLLSESAGSWVAAVRHVAAPGQEPVGLRLTALVVHPVTAATLLVPVRLSRASAQVYPAPAGELLLETWHLDDLDAGTRAVLSIAGDVVVHARGLPAADDECEVVDLATPPSGAQPAIAR